MINKDTLTNTLIKRKNLRKKLNKVGILRVNKEAIKNIEKVLENFLNKLFFALKEKIIIKGKKTLEKKDIEEVVKDMQKNESWEI